MRDLSNASAADLPAMLAALDHASPLGANWIRNAFESVADRELSQKHPLPVAELEQFIRDKSHQPRSRRLAYEWLVKVDPSATSRLIPGMLLDPAPEFAPRRRRHEASHEAAKVDPNERQGKGRPALSRGAAAARFRTTRLKRSRRRSASSAKRSNIADHFAFITRYSVIGPFDNPDGKLLEPAIRPEKEIRLDAQYDGTVGKVSWQADSTTTNEYGIVDIAKQVKPYKGAAMYAAGGVRLAAGSASWNCGWRRRTPGRSGSTGNSVFARTNTIGAARIDQYRVPVVMRPGRNTILLKICQDEEMEVGPRRYQFQLRVCDSSGRGVRSQPISVSGGAIKLNVLIAPRGLAVGAVVVDSLRRGLAAVSRQRLRRRSPGRGARRVWTRRPGRRPLSGRGLSGPIVVGDRVYRHDLQRTRSGPAARPGLRDGPTGRAALGPPVLGDRPHAVPSEDGRRDADAGQ